MESIRRPLGESSLPSKGTRALRVEFVRITQTIACQDVMKDYPVSRRLAHLLSAAILVSGCSSGGLTEVPGVDADNVSLILSRDGKTILGDSVTVRVINRGSSSVYLAQGCPGSLGFNLSRWNGAQWVPIVNAVACPLPLQPGPLVLAAGDTMLFARFFSDPGRYRGDIGVGLQSTLVDQRTVTSNSVDIGTQ